MSTTEPYRAPLPHSIFRPWHRAPGIWLAYLQVPLVLFWAIRGDAVGVLASLVVLDVVLVLLALFEMLRIPEWLWQRAGHGRGLSVLLILLLPVLGIYAYLAVARPAVRLASAGFEPPAEGSSANEADDDQDGAWAHWL